MKQIAVLILFALLNSTIVQATTFHVDSGTISGTPGSDGGNGTTTPWKSWNKVLSAIGAGTVGPGDTISIMPGRYLATGAYPSVHSGGGTAINPLTITIDTSIAGNVEVVGATTAGNTGATSWVQASTCSSGTDSVTSISAVGTPCDTNADCGNSGTPTCSLVPNVFYTIAPGVNESSGVVAGTVYQPGATPGAEPKIFEILYAPSTTPIVMPTFTQGHDQAWPYSPIAHLNSQNQDLCTGVETPWYCCTGVGTGCAGKGNRIYVQVAASTSGTMIAPGTNTGGFSAASPPVEIPIATLGDFDGNTSSINYVNITNNNNGRTFYFWWVPTTVFTFRNAHDWNIEDSDIAYNTRIWPHLIGSDGPKTTQSVFPRDSAGPMYLIFITAGAKPQRIYNINLNRTVVHKDAGDEGIHASSSISILSCNSGANNGKDCTTNDINSSTGCGTGAVCTGGGCCVPIQTCTTIADCTNTVGLAVACNPSGQCVFSRNDHLNVFNSTFDKLPWAVVNGNQPNSASVIGSWPPAGYAAWSGQFGTHFSPLGGGGQSPGAWIIQTPFNHFNHVTVTDSGPPQFEQDNHFDFGNLVENSFFDGALSQYGAAAAAVAHPAVVVTQCNNGPGGATCGGFGGDRWISFGQTFLYAGVPGNSWNNNIFINMWNQAFWGDYSGSSTGLIPTANTSLITGNYFALKGNGNYVSGALNQISVGSNWNGIFENNIIVQQTAPAGSGASIAFPASSGPNAVIDKNFYGIGTLWKAGATLYSAFATYKTAVSPNDANSIQNTVSIDGSYCLNAGSPGIDAGANLSSLGITTDYYGTSRPQGAAYDMGPCEVTASGTTTSTTSTTTTTLSNTTTTTLLKSLSGITVGPGSARQ